jgi:hypothetical protein
MGKSAIGTIGHTLQSMATALTNSSLFQSSDAPQKSFPTASLRLSAFHSFRGLKSMAWPGLLVAAD